jgi:hypothetical protein
VTPKVAEWVGARLMAVMRQQDHDLLASSLMAAE